MRDLVIGTSMCHWIELSNLNQNNENVEVNKKDLWSKYWQYRLVRSGVPQDSAGFVELG
jgi:hypothetical protein